MHAQVMSNHGQKKLHGARPIIYNENSHKVAMYQCHQAGLTRCLEHREFDHLKEDRDGGGWEDRKEDKTETRQRHGQLVHTP